MATTANAQDSLLQYDDLEFTEIIEEQPIQEERTVQTNSQETTHAEGPMRAPNDDDNTRDKSSLWAIFTAGFIGGFAALLMPCIFPMLPFTVSYFTKSSHNKGTAVIHASIYGLSIVAIYVLLGILITVIFGADALNSLSTNGIFSFAFFALLVLFAFSFFWCV